MSKYTFEQIARVCHQTNKAYCEMLGDMSQADWEQAPEWQRLSAIAGVEFHHLNPNAGDSASHDSWMTQKVSEGWVYGPTKDVELKQHHCIVPFGDLPVEQQVKDTIFRSLCGAMEKLP